MATAAGKEHGQEKCRVLGACDGDPTGRVGTARVAARRERGIPLGAPCASTHCDLFPVPSSRPLAVMMRTCRLSFPPGVTTDEALAGPWRGDGQHAGGLEVAAVTAGPGVSPSRGRGVSIMRGVGASRQDDVLLKMRTLDPASFFFL